MPGLQPQSSEPTAPRFVVVPRLLQTVEDGIDKDQWQMRAFVQATQTDPNNATDIDNGIDDGKAIDLPGQLPGVDPKATT